MEFSLEIINFKDVKFEPCIQCYRCGAEGKCNKFVEDDFNIIFDKIKVARTTLIISPLYALIPSKLAAFLDRMVSITYFTEQCGKVEIPLNNKRFGVICYDACGRNTELEYTIKKVLKPNFTGYSAKNNAIDYRFIGDMMVEQSETNDIIGYIDTYFKRNFGEIFNKMKSSF